MNYSREKDDKCYELAKLQSRIFERAAKDNIPSSYFAKVFFNSKYCRMLDDLSYFDFYPSEDEIYSYIKNNVKMTRGNVFPPQVMHWIGYLLREWAYTYDVYSKQITKLVPMSYLLEIYDPYHSLDIQKAIKMIGGDRNIDLKETKDELTLRILRTITK